MSHGLTRSRIRVSNVGGVLSGEAMATNSASLSNYSKSELQETIWIQRIVNNL